MIRKNLLFCKLIRIKTSSKSLFDSYMEQFQPELETCPICGSTGNCHIHDYYGRSIIDFRTGRRQKEDLCIMRVFCDSCEHAHAILPDVIVPYSSYSLFFILFILGEYFAGLHTIEQLCERFDISLDSYSAFSMDFIRLTARSFLQSHRNPVLTTPKNARYRQTVFAPDIFLF